jgi:hypothetical protein
MPDFTQQDQPYNNATAEQQIAIQRALAQQLMGAKMPQANMVVPGGPNGFVVNTKGASISAGLQQLLGSAGLVASGQNAKDNDANARFLVMDPPGFG